MSTGGLRIGVDIDDVERRERQAERSRRSYARNRDRILAAKRTPEGRAKANAQAREYHARNRERLNAQRRARHIESRYGLTEEAFEAMLAAQGGACAICHMSDPPRGWHIDHDHACCATPARSCGQCVRGILCGPCNKGLGTFQDSPDLLRQAARYLEAAQ
ncbi:MAG TPA: endonuclease VII domain-containing protein [Aeromicrobium sp.]|nr:endonuclease VII domain-containing protein [Aeromicrobium sp.]HKY58350.1 endonuclease VII domain-containing protein [Aeromicrobium sp.]